MGTNQTRGRESRKDPGQKKAEEPQNNREREKEGMQREAQASQKLGCRADRRSKQASQSPQLAKPGTKLDIHERQERGLKSKKKKNRESKRR